MFIIVFILFLSICVLSIFTVSKILEFDKDIDTLYENYSKELEKITKANIMKNSGVVNK